MNIYITIISSLFIFLFPYIGKFWFSRTTLASTVVSLGILGTFAGIFIGLLDFDVTQIEIALPALLEGLKTAFLTSIAGMCASLLLKLYPAVYGIRLEAETEPEAEGSQVISILSSIENCMQEANRNSNENLTRLNASFNSFSEHISELHVNAFTTALQKAMDSWNSQISSEINEAIQEINQTVKSLREIQETNNQQIKIVSNNIHASLETLNQVSGNIGLFLNKSISLNTRQQESVTTQMNNLGSLVKTTETQLERQLNTMEERLKREMSAMEQFSHTLITIINKLTLDHNAILKRQQEES